ncbi:MAG: response regulator [Tepidisphaeraceae bacterium]
MDRKVLIVDDNPDQGKPLAMILKLSGYDAEFVTSGPAALSWTRATIPGLMIVDLMMPGMSGLEVLREIRTNPRTRDVPVVIYSACSDESQMARARHEGAADYWVKVGLHIDEIRRRVETYFPDSVS